MSDVTGEVLLRCEDLRVSVESKEVVKGVTFEVHAGEKIALMGPNGSGKSTLAQALMGHPSYTITSGRVFLQDKEITEAPPDERARLGLFLAFQYPVAVPGVSVANFLRQAVNACRGEEVPIREFRKEVKEKLKLLGVKGSFMERYLNDGFSGGEKKRVEILQLAMLKPIVAILDETDSGLDIDALQAVSEGINNVAGKEMGVFLVTHYQRILNYVKPDRVFVFMDGRIVREGGAELAHQLEEKGYDWIAKEVLAADAQS